MNLSSTGVDCSMGRNLMASGITLTNVSKLVLKLLTAPLIVENADNNRMENKPMNAVNISIFPKFVERLVNIMMTLIRLVRFLMQKLWMEEFLLKIIFYMKLIH